MGDSPGVRYGDTLLTEKRSRLMGSYMGKILNINKKGDCHIE